MWRRRETSEVELLREEEVEEAEEEEEGKTVVWEDSDWKRPHEIILEMSWAARTKFSLLREACL